MGTIGSAQSQSVQLKDAFEVSEQHLDLLAQSPRFPSLPGFGNRSHHVAGLLVD